MPFNVPFNPLTLAVKNPTSLDITLAPATKTIRSIAYNPNDTYYYGINTAATYNIVRSRDLVNWATVFTCPVAVLGIDIAYGNGIIMATEDNSGAAIDAGVVFSADGTNWTRLALTNTATGNRVRCFAINHLSSNTFLVSGSDPTAGRSIAFSTDGITYNSNEVVAGVHGTAIANFANRYYFLGPVNTIYVGDSLSALATTGVSLGGTPSSGTFTMFAYDGTSIVAIATTTDIRYSIDAGVTWSANKFQTAMGSCLGLHFNSIVGKFCFFGSGGTVYLTSDFETFTGGSYTNSAGGANTVTKGIQSPDRGVIYALGTTASLLIAGMQV